MKNQSVKTKQLLICWAILLFILFVGDPISYGATGWLPAENISNDLVLSGRPAIAIDGNNTAHVVWVGNTGNHNNEEIIYTRQDSLGRWESPINISNTQGKSARPAIAAGQDNVVHVTWRDERDAFTDIFYNRKDINGWRVPVNISNTDATSFKSRIAVDILGYPHVVWEEGGLKPNTMQIAYSYFDGYKWSAPIGVSSQNMCAWPDLAASPFTQDIYVVWGYYMQQSISKTEIMFNAERSFTWGLRPTNISLTPGASERPAIAVDSMGNIHVVWRDGIIPCNAGERCDQEGSDYYPGKGDIYYSVRDYNGWSVPVAIVHTPVDSARPAIAVDSLDNIH
ncbi:MAG: hypothetical protein HZC11_01545, partial [Nitrospirae bacterium]|nr:hypothetical protein [Nitrospirota bacterium]